jgi:8-oxo-dGTP pyrophosphatase MutT (NUDIX family)
MSEVVSKVAALRPDGMLLMGQRRDNGKFSLPGGHLDDGEHPEMAAHRELGEETGLDTDVMHHLGTKDVKDGAVRVHAYQCDVSGEPDGDQDPDGEFQKFVWVDPENMPREVMSNLHNSPDVVLELIGANGKPWASMHAEPDQDDA